jgi:hypothetical protein
MFRQTSSHVLAVGLAFGPAFVSAAATAPPPPGVVINHSPAATAQYIGSPGIAILPDGTYLAKCERFGPGIADEKIGVTSVFVSRDQGRSWSALAEVPGMYWATLFAHQGAAYLLGTNREYGYVVISRSLDGGKTWSRPASSDSGLLRADGKFHCAPVPIVVHGGRLWRAMEDAKGPGGWGSHFRAFMMSAPVDADLLKATSWTSSNALARDPAWNRNDFGGWLEGNAVVAPDGGIVDVLRVAVGKGVEKAAVVRLSPDGKTAAFDPVNGLVDFPGGAKKFTIRWDPQTRLYWSLVNTILLPSAPWDRGASATRCRLQFPRPADMDGEDDPAPASRPAQTRLSVCRLALRRSRYCLCLPHRLGRRRGRRS